MMVHLIENDTDRLMDIFHSFQPHKWFFVFKKHTFKLKVKFQSMVEKTLERKSHWSNKKVHTQMSCQQ